MLNLKTVHYIKIKEQDLTMENVHDGRIKSFNDLLPEEKAFFGIGDAEPQDNGWLVRNSFPLLAFAVDEEIYFEK